MREARGHRAEIDALRLPGLEDRSFRGCIRHRREPLVGNITRSHRPLGRDTPPVISRPFELSPGVRWWPSTLWQTTTLELVRGTRRLLVDPGIAPWEVRDAAGDGVDAIVLTHADWDHVLGIGLLPDAQVVASRRTADRLALDGAREEIERKAAVFYIPLDGLERLRVDRVVDPPAEADLAGWRARFHSVPGHMDDATAIAFTEEGVLAVGDYLSACEAPFVHGSVNEYRATLRRLTQLIEGERPAHVVPGHGPPHDAERALAIAREDLAYLEAVIAFAEAGRSPDDAATVPLPPRVGAGNPAEHEATVRLACLESPRSG